MAMGDNGFLDAFPGWLKSLSVDCVALSQVLSEAGIAEGARVSIAGGLNYLFKSLDLIPDGIEDLGFIDDAFVIRVAAAQAVGEDPAIGGKDSTGTVKRLAEEADVVRSFLDVDYPRLDRFVRALRSSAVRGRQPLEIATESSVRESFASEVQSWAQSFEPPTFAREAKNLVKLRSFLGAKLPS